MIHKKHKNHTGCFSRRALGFSGTVRYFLYWQPCLGSVADQELLHLWVEVVPGLHQRARVLAPEIYTYLITSKS